MRVGRKRRPGGFQPISSLKLSAVPLSGKLSTNEEPERPDKSTERVARLPAWSPTKCPPRVVSLGVTAAQARDTWAVVHLHTEIVAASEYIVTYSEIITSSLYPWTFIHPVTLIHQRQKVKLNSILTIKACESWLGSSRYWQLIRSSSPSLEIKLAGSSHSRELLVNEEMRAEITS